MCMSLLIMNYFWVFPVQMRNLCKMSGLLCQYLERRVYSCDRHRHMRILNLSSSLRKAKRVQGTKNIVRYYMRSNTLQEQLLVSSSWTERPQVLYRMCWKKIGVGCSLLSATPKTNRLRVLERYKIILQMKFSSLIRFLFW